MRAGYSDIIFMNFAFQKDINKLRTLLYFMSEKVIDIMGPIKFGWNTLKVNLKFFVVLMTIVGIASFLPQLALFILPSGESSSWWPLYVLILAVLFILFIIINIMFQVGLIKISIIFRNGGTPEIRDLYSSKPIVLLNYVIASFFYGLMVMVGLLLFIIPGIFLALKYQFYGYLITDRGMGPVEAIRESGRLTDGAKKDLFVFWLAFFCGIIAIMIALGLLIALPVGLMMAAVSEDLVPIFTIVISLITTIIDLMVIAPLTNLAMADIYKTLQTRLTALATSPSQAPVEA
jgi:uncharacterized membrane protein